MAVHKEERREGYIELPYTFIEKLEDHIQKEEVRDQKTEEIFKQGTERMDAIEHDLAIISGIVKKADGFIAATRIATNVIGVVGLALISTLIWIAKEKNAEFLKVQDNIDAHTVEIVKILDVLEAKIKSDDKRHDRVDAALGATNGHVGTK